MRGVRLNAVQTAISSGRIHKTADGKIDVDEANKEWFMNTDPAKSRKADPLLREQPKLQKPECPVFSKPKPQIFIIGRCLLKPNSK